MLGCHHARPAVPLYGGTPGIPDAIWTEYGYPTSDVAAITAGLHPLRVDTLPSGHREIRIWASIAIGTPSVMYRIVDDGRVTGEVVRYWTRYPSDSTNWVAALQRGHCTDFRRRAARLFDHPVESNTCRALFTRSPDWRAFLRRIEHAGAWTLEDPSTLPPERTMIIVTDGWGFTIELRDGAAYRAYRYDNPEAHPNWPHAANAIEIGHALRMVDSLVR